MIFDKLSWALMFIALLFAILALHGFFCKLKIRKDILKAITKNKVLINQQSEQNKAKITASLLSINSPELEQLIEKLMATEYECYKTLTTAYIDYHPAAVNIIPLILNQISTSFMSCMDYVHAHTQIVSDNGDPAVDSNVEQSEKLVDNQEEDVWVINKEFQPGEIKNVNKLPNKLVEKIIEYSSNEGDFVCDFFMGNFTTADCALRFGRKVIGFEINPVSYNYHIERISQIEFGIDVVEKTEVENPFFNQGKKLSDKEKTEINNRFSELATVYKTKKEKVNVLSKEFGRGAFSINKIIKNAA